MARAVIADSDDDGELENSPQPQGPERPNTHAALSSDRVSQSISTDPVLFQSVFNEQDEAARQISERSTPIPQHQGGALRAGSPMSSDPLHGREDYGMIEHVPTATHQVASFKITHKREGDPWEIPSSPEDTSQVAVTSQRKAREEKRDSKPRSKESQSQPHPSPDEVQASPHVTNEQVLRASKRRKVTSRQSSTQETEEIDLVKLPSTQDADRGFQEPASSIMPPPTLPIDRSSFIVAPKPPASSKRKEYQSFALESEDEPSQDQGPSRKAPGGTIARSSGSATNVNTPRSELSSSRNPELGFGREHRGNGDGKGTNDAGEWNSSPDEIQMAGPIISPLQAARRKGRGSRTSAPAHTDVADEHDMNHTPEDMHGQDDDEEGDSDFVEKPVKPKKQRGRPRKSAGVDEASRATNPSGSHSAGGRSVTKPKRKRGRPRKADQQAVGAEAQRSENLGVGTHGAATPEEAIKTEGSGVRGEEHATHGQDKPADAAETRFATTLGADDCSIPDTLATNGCQSKGIMSARAAGGTEMPEDASKDKIAEGCREGKNTATRPAGSTPALSTSSRPLYRVGLSKRSKIAPLLKTVRK